MWTRDDIARTGYPHRRNKMPDIPRLRDSRGTKVLPRLAELAAVFILPKLSSFPTHGIWQLSTINLKKKVKSLNQESHHPKCALEVWRTMSWSAFRLGFDV